MFGVLILRWLIGTQIFFLSLETNYFFSLFMVYTKTFFFFSFFFSFFFFFFFSLHISSHTERRYWSLHIHEVCSCIIDFITESQQLKQFARLWERTNALTASDAQQTPIAKMINNLIIPVCGQWRINNYHFKSICFAIWWIKDKLYLNFRIFPSGKLMIKPIIKR